MTGAEISTVGLCPNQRAVGVPVSYYLALKPKSLGLLVQKVEYACCIHCKMNYLSFIFMGRCRDLLQQKGYLNLMDFFFSFFHFLLGI